jgi:predicted nucleic acid-binding protein
VIFIDTGAFIARYVERDQHHSTALKAWRRLPKLGRRHYTSNFVLDETVTLLGRRSDYVFAADRARHLYASRALEILRPSQDDEIAAVALFEKYADQEVSFTDCVSFVLMRKLRIQRVFAFDRHFRLAGLETWP